MTLPENTNPARLDQTNLLYRTDDATMPNTIGASSQQGASRHQVVVPPQDNNLSMFRTPGRGPVASRAAHPSPPAQEEIYLAAAKKRRDKEAQERRSKRRRTTRGLPGLNLSGDQSKLPFHKRLESVANTGNQVTPAYNADASGHSQPTITLK